ncbi:MAG: C-factor [Hyphomonadaceae bacterium]|jgi:NAD(P)-dependent dehydrogenase (short-subunit alcohol dehydrogenase family)|uniref:SDR family NAD(P)-dependent oxidoreductase n=2 Tax=Henriciella TaxID=453849 RepID=UPI000C3D7896|nr:C-factor [Hyphomonadaceae bacterium]|tara:strand:+ start:2142 stop:2858 length:717 start_codon:yes stop_codon:yes gene_type:complete
MSAVIIGATGGIGRALALGLAERGTQGTIHALSRSGGGDWPDGVIPGRIDILDEASIEDAAARLKEDGPVELCIVATGLLSDGEDLQPEKSWRHQSMAAYERVFRLNTFGPGLVAKHVLPLMTRGERAVFAALSARVGSIGDNGYGGWHAYRASKAALNMLIRNFAIEWTRKSEESICVGLHPGTVDTQLSAPFQGNVPDKQLFSPQQSAGYLLDVIGKLSPADTGKVFDWQGKEIEP